MPDALRVHADDRAAWWAWLIEHAAASTGIWLVYDKGPGRRLPYDDIVEEALCFGWIDSRPRSLDESHAMLYVAPGSRAAAGRGSTGSVWNGWSPRAP